MAHSETGARPSAKGVCSYWDGTKCIAPEFFDATAITCYHEGTCDGFGTCRDCSKYTLGGLKLGKHDGEGGTGQTPINLRVLNIRAQIQPCCHWKASPLHFSLDNVAGSLRRGKHLPVLVPNNSAPTHEFEVKSFCDLDDARPWQVGVTVTDSVVEGEAILTESFGNQNPTPYGCNGAKPECPFYTGPAFKEVVDSKLDTGSKISAKQIMELRFYSQDWKNTSDPRAKWEATYSQPDIWAWAGTLDSNNLPQMKKVTISDFSTDTPIISVGGLTSATKGTVSKNKPPDYPTLIKELSILEQGTLKVLWPSGTTKDNPFVRKVFKLSDTDMVVSVQTNSPYSLFGINLTAHPQSGDSDTEFVKRIRRDFPADVFEINTSTTLIGVPQSAVVTKLVYNPTEGGLNQVRLFLDRVGEITGENDSESSGSFPAGTMITSDIFIKLDFHHAFVAQTRFHDKFGHTMIDPWINHFTRMEIDASILDLTGNTKLNSVFWDSISADGKKTFYAVEEVVDTTSDTGLVSWQPLGCRYVAVTMNDININRVFLWKMWETATNGQQLFAQIDRSNNPALLPTESTTIPLTLSFNSPTGEFSPANVAFFVAEATAAMTPFDVTKDKLVVRYSYTKYKQGPIEPSDTPKLKFPQDVGQVITTLPYDIRSTGTSVYIDGTFLKVGNKKIYSCDDLIGNCYTQAASDNQGNARVVFKSGGIGEDTVKSVTTMVSDCVADFELEFGGQSFEDGVPVTFTETAKRLKDKDILGGEQKYLFLFEDEEGRIIGKKRVNFLLQSATAQARDVEIKYKWSTPIEYAAIEHQFFITAKHAAPMYFTQNGMVQTEYVRDPFCGDHLEHFGGVYSAYDRSTQEHGALWYPYNDCEMPRYHTDGEPFDNPIKYDNTVEGFLEGKRPPYWERARVLDCYLPVVVRYLNFLGCTYKTVVGNLHTLQPFLFKGYTKIRSQHPFGYFSVDREALRVSRHFQKRNVNIKDQVITQEEGGLSVTLTDEFKALLLDSSGNINGGSSLQTPIWQHIQDGVSIVNPGSEDLESPLAHLLLAGTGSTVFSESFINQRVPIPDVFEERDYTKDTQRNTDGSLPLNPDGTTINDDDSDGVAEVDVGTDIQLVYKDANTAWAWLAAPPQPVRGAPRITGVTISNPTSTSLKKNLEPVAFTDEGNHTLKFTPIEFSIDNVTGLATTVTPMTLQLDDGPPLGINVFTGVLEVPTLDFIEDQTSPYLASNHTSSDYTYTPLGNSAGGFGMLADGRGLQRYTKGNSKLAAFSGVIPSVIMALAELPHEVDSISSFPFATGKYPDNGIIKEYEGTDNAPVEYYLSFFPSHNYIETVEIIFSYGGDFDVPAINFRGTALSEDGTFSDVKLVPDSEYLAGDGVPEKTVIAKSFVINRSVGALTLGFGARRKGKKMHILSIDAKIRRWVAREETLKTFSPKITRSVGTTGTHKPADLLFYFTRTQVDFYNGGLQPSLKFTSRTVKDLIPQFEFSDTSGTRFNYNNISPATIPNYLQDADGAAYIAAPVSTFSKGWSLVTTNHEKDPGGDLASSNYIGGRADEGLQEQLYRDAASLLDSTTTTYNGFWHPQEIEEFSKAGVNLAAFTWVLTLQSTVAPLRRVLRHENYGCDSAVTNESYDGVVHAVEPWQAKGAWTWASRALWNTTCGDLIMQHSRKFLFSLYGTTEYHDKNLTSKYSYTFAFGLTDFDSYISAGLIDKEHTGIKWGGFLGFGGPTTSQQGAIPVSPGGPV